MLIRMQCGRAAGSGTALLLRGMAPEPPVPTPALLPAHPNARLPLAPGAAAATAEPPHRPSAGPSAPVARVLPRGRDFFLAHTIQNIFV